MRTRSEGPSVSRIAPRLAVLGALAATAGDLGQLWCVNAARPELQLASPPPSVIVVATLAGALGIPLYGLGYYARARMARAAAPRRAAAVAASGFAFAAIGGSVHATTGVLIATRTGEIASGLDPLQGILASGPIVGALWALGIATFLAAALAEAGLPQPAACRLANPLVLTAALTVIGASLPLPWRDFLTPAAVNVAHVAFFASLAGRATRPHPAGADTADRALS